MYLPILVKSRISFFFFLGYFALLNFHFALADTEASSSSLQSQLGRLTKEIESNPEWNIHSVLITKGGNLLYEKYFSGPDERWGTSLGRVDFKQETIHDLRSISKSIVSTLIGIARDEGLIKNLDQKVSEFFPGQKLPEQWKKVTLRHLLTMSAGLKWEEEVPYSSPLNDEIRFINSGGNIEYVFGKEFTEAPGKNFLYNGGLTEILGRVVAKVSGTNLQGYFEEKILDPLGIDRKKYEWVKVKLGFPSGASGLRMRPIDLHKIGVMLSNNGKYEGKTVISSSWISEATRNHMPMHAETGPRSIYQGYGYQWLIPNFLGPKAPPAFVGSGNGGQMLVVIPKRQIVIQIMAGRYNNFSLINAEIIRKWIQPALGI